MRCEMLPALPWKNSTAPAAFSAGTHQAASRSSSSVAIVTGSKRKPYACGVAATARPTSGK